MTRFTYPLIVLTLCVCPPLAAVDAQSGVDPCAQRDEFQNAEVTLERAELDERGVFVGVFSLVNRSNNTLQFKGFTANGLIHIVRPERSVEYLDDIANEWRPVLDLPGTFPPRSHELLVQPGKTARFSAQLMGKDTANRGSGIFRLMMRSTGGRQCFVSRPFQAQPLRAPTEGFRSAPGSQ